MALPIKTMESHWTNWEHILKSMGSDPYFQELPYTDHVRRLTSFVACIHTCNTGPVHTVTTQTVSMALMATDQMIALAVRTNQTKLAGLDTFIP